MSIIHVKKKGGGSTDLLFKLNTLPSGLPPSEIRAFVNVFYVYEDNISVAYRILSATKNGGGY